MHFIYSWLKLEKKEDVLKIIKDISKFMYVLASLALISFIYGRGTIIDVFIFVALGFLLNYKKVGLLLL